MNLDRMHPEEVKAALRRRYGTVTRFVALRGLPKTGVSDVLRGRTSRRVRDAIEEALQEGEESIKLDSSGKASRAHRLNGAAK